MRDWNALQAAWEAGPPAPRDEGSVRLLVARRGDGVHDVVARATLSPDAGLVGDRWACGPRPSRSRQVTLMNARVAHLVADGLPLHSAGDNVLVDLDLSVAALPAGTRLRVGTAVLEVSAAPHLGCKKFRARFGAGALAWINDPAHADQRLRGINCRIVTAGVVWVGDPIGR